VSARSDEIVDTARALLEAEGAEALSMRRLADEIGIRAPSLYKHVRDKEELEAAIIAEGLADLAERFERAVSEDDPLAAFARAYRAFAREHPHLYRLMTERPLPRDRLPAGLEERAGRPVVDAVGGDEATGRALWAFAHGMTILELNDRFPPGADLDAAWRTGLSVFSGR
jgi:AcrR family transcriptional regulator